MSDALDSDFFWQNDNIDRKKKVFYLKTEEGKILKVYSDHRFNSILIGDRVMIGRNKIEYGLYKLKNGEIKYEVKNSEIIAEYYVLKCIQQDGRFIEIDGNRKTGISKGCKVWMDNIPAPDGVYKKNWYTKIKVEKGIIINKWIGL